MTDFSINSLKESALQAQQGMQSVQIQVGATMVDELGPVGLLIAAFDGSRLDEAQALLGQYNEVKRLLDEAYGVMDTFIDTAGNLYARL